MHLVSKNHCSRTWAWGRRRPTTGCAGSCAGAARKSWTGGGDHAAGHGALRAQARAHGNMRSGPGIFNFVKLVRVGEEACPMLEQAKARLKELFPSKPGGRTPRWSSATASAWP